MDEAEQILDAMYARRHRTTTDAERVAFERDFSSLRWFHTGGLEPPDELQRKGPEREDVTEWKSKTQGQKHG